MTAIFFLRRKKREKDKRDIEAQIANDYPDGFESADSNVMGQSTSASVSPQGDPFDIPSLETMVSEIAALSNGETDYVSPALSPTPSKVSSHSATSLRSASSLHKSSSPPTFCGWSDEQLLELAHLSQLEEKRQLAAASVERHTTIKRRKRANIAALKSKVKKVMNIDFSKKSCHVASEPLWEA